MPTAFVFAGKVDESILHQIATRLLANGVIETIHFSPYIPEQFPAGHQQPFALRRVAIRQLTDAALAKLSREGHLFLSLAEMRRFKPISRNRIASRPISNWKPSPKPGASIAFTRRSRARVEVVDESGKTVRRYGNLIKETIFKSTQELMEKNPGFCLSVFKDNAGVIAFDDTDAVCFKVETHNHPSAIEPYGGSATGVGGVHSRYPRTGLAAKPIANTDVFCVAYPDASLLNQNRKSQIANLPKGRHPSQAHPPAGRRRRAGLRQSHGHSDGQRRGLFRRSISRQSAGVLRLRGIDPRDKIARQQRPAMRSC